MDKKYTVKVILTDNTTGRQYFDEESTDRLWDVENIASSKAYHAAEALSEDSEE